MLSLFWISGLNELKNLGPWNLISLEHTVDVFSACTVSFWTVLQSAPPFSPHLHGPLLSTGPTTVQRRRFIPPLHVRNLITKIALIKQKVKIWLRVKVFEGRKGNIFFMSPLSNSVKINQLQVELTYQKQVIKFSFTGHYWSKINLIYFFSETYIVF